MGYLVINPNRENPTPIVSKIIEHYHFFTIDEISRCGPQNVLSYPWSQGMAVIGV